MIHLHGVGSVSSPIVISDDEDESSVERALEDRLSDPRNAEDSLEPFEYGDDEEIPGLRPSEYLHDIHVHDSSTEQDSERKRKREQETPEIPSLSSSHVPKVILGIPNPKKKQKLLEQKQQKQAVDDPPESKSARKKRRKRERFEAEAASLLADIPVLATKPATPPPQPVASSSQVESRRSPPRPPSRPPFEEGRPSSPPFEFLHLAYPHPNHYEMGPSYAPFPPTHVPPLVDFRPPTFVAHSLPMLSLDVGSFPPPAITPFDFPLQINTQQGLIDKFYEPQSVAASQPSVLPRNVVKKIIGMTADLDTTKGHGIFKATSISPPDRTLVLECLPKKFRNPEFIRKWARRYGQIANLDLDAKLGKALVVFEDAKVAREAWASPRFPTGDGKEHIRAYWYRVQGAEFEEGEIEEWELEDIEKLKHKAIQPRPPPSISSGSAMQYVFGKPNGPTAARPIAATSQSNLDSSVPAHAHDPPYRVPLYPPSSRSAESSQLTVVSSSARSYQLQYPTHDDAMDLLLKYERPAGANASATQPDIVMSLPDDSGSQMQSLPATKSFSRAVSPQKGSTTTALPATSSAEISSSASSPRPSSIPSSSTSGPSTPADNEVAASDESLSLKAQTLKQTLLARQKELEERIARGRLQIAARTLSPPGSDSPVQTGQSGDMRLTDVSANSTIVNGTAPATGSHASADINVLRQLVQASKKTKASASAATAETPFVETDNTGARPLSASSIKSITPTVSPRSNLAFGASLSTTIDFEDLAASFITETIQSVAPGCIPHPLPPQPTMSSKSSEKGMLAAKQAALEKHIAESKLLMAKLSTATTKAEKHNIMVELRASSRRSEEAMKNYSSEVNTPSEEASRPFFVPRPSWPQTEETCILDLSDDEDE